MSKEQRYLLLQIYQRLSKPLEEFIQQAPAFEGDGELAAMLGEQMADLECKIRDIS